MTDNKFWLVWSSNETPIRVTSLRDAKLKSLEWLKINPYRKVFIMQPIKSFEGDVKIIESDFNISETGTEIDMKPLESETPTPEFKVGDKVKYRPIKYSSDCFDGVIIDTALDFVFCEYKCPSKGVVLTQIHKDMAHEFLTHA
jgi:hypothetical protein